MIYYKTVADWLVFCSSLPILLPLTLKRSTVFQKEKVLRLLMCFRASTMGLSFSSSDRPSAQRIDVKSIYCESSDLTAERPGRFSRSMPGRQRLGPHTNRKHYFHPGMVN